MNQKKLENSTNKLLNFKTVVEEAYWPRETFCFISSYKADEGLKRQIVISEEIAPTPITFAQLPLACANKEAFGLNF